MEFSGECITTNEEGTVRWSVPGEAKFRVSVPYEGETPDRVIMHLIKITPRGEVQLGGMSAKPERDGNTLMYSAALPIYDQSIEGGLEKCRIRTVSPTVGPKAVTVHEGDLEIEFVKGPQDE